MSKEMVISANPHETRVAILEEGQLCEFYVEREKEFALVGSIYKGRVTRVLPGMQSAFVEIGLDSDAFLYVSDFLEALEDVDHIETPAEEKVQKMQDQGGQVFNAASPAAPALEPADVESAPLNSSEHSPAEHAPEHDQPADAPSAPAPSGNVASAHNAPPSSHPPRYENRHDSRPHRGGGRDFRGGRGGRRGGRPNRGGGERRYGRELPQSKYASHRPYEDPATESAPPEGYVPTILPGESLAKYKAPSSAPSVAPPESAPPLTPASFPPEPTRESLSPAPAPEPIRSEHSAPSLRVSSTGFEPLPGESIAKWKGQEPQIEQHAEPSSAASEPSGSVSGESFVARDNAETDIAHFEVEAESEPASGHTDHAESSPADLPEDGAAALTEHVAEAQSEAAALQAEEDHIAPFGEPRSIDDDLHESHEAEDAIVDVEEHELDDEDDSESDMESEADAAHSEAHELDEAAAESESLLASAAEQNGAEVTTTDAMPAE